MREKPPQLRRFSAPSGLYGAVVDFPARSDYNQGWNRKKEGVFLADTRKEALFTTVPVQRAIISLAVPTVISQIITVVYNMADTFFVGQLGDPNQVASATIALPLFIMLTAIANLFGIGGASVISRCLGCGQRDKARSCASFCIWSAGAVAACYGAGVYLLLPKLLPILGANDGTWDNATRYLFWTVGLGAAPTVLNPMLAHLVRAEGRSRQASFGVAFGGILNIALDPLFIFVFHMDVEGAAIATLLSNLAALCYFIALIVKNRESSVIRLSPKYYTWRLGIPAEVLSVGLPSFLISMMATISNTVLNHTIAGHANEAVAGMGIAKRIDLMAFAVAQGMAQGTLPLIGYNYTSGNRKRMLDAIKTLCIYCLIVSVTVGVLLYVAAVPAARLFIRDTVTAEHGAAFLRVVSIACPATSLNFFAITVFQATGKKLQPTLLSLLRRGSLDVLLMGILDRAAGLDGIAWASPVADITSALIAITLVVPHLRRLKKDA